MSISLDLRFSKLDKYENITFISTQAREPDIYKKLTNLYKQVRKQNPDVFLPLYSNYADESSNKKYAKISFSKTKKFEFKENAVYHVEFSINKREHNGRVFINCHILSSRMVKPPATRERGQAMTFTLEPDEDDSE